MNTATKFNIIRVVTWAIVGVCMIAIFCTGNTIEEWGDNRTKTILLAVLFLIGFGSDFVLRFLERRNRDKSENEKQSKVINQEALGVGAIIALTYVFIVTISLYTNFEQSGFVPVGWVWFIAYSTIVATNLSVGGVALYLRRKTPY